MNNRAAEMVAEVQGRERVLKAFQHVASLGRLPRTAWCLNRTFRFNVMPLVPKQAVVCLLREQQPMTGRLHAAVRLPGLVRLEVQGRDWQAHRHEDTQAVILHCPSPYLVGRLRLDEDMPRELCAPASLTSLVVTTCGGEITFSTIPGSTSQHRLQIGDTILTLPQSLEPRKCKVRYHFGKGRPGLPPHHGKGIPALPPQLVDLDIKLHAVRSLVLPLPPRLRLVTMATLWLDSSHEIQLRRQLVENLPASVKELRLKYALTRFKKRATIDEIRDIKWPDGLRRLFLVHWRVRMDLPPRITSLIVVDAEPDPLTYLLKCIASSALESLYIAGRDYQWGEVSLPITLRQLTLGRGIDGSGVNAILKHGFPPRLEEFRVDAHSDFNAPLVDLPSTLRVLHLNESFDALLANIPSRLREAVLPASKIPLVAAGTLPAAARVSFFKQQELPAQAQQATASQGTGRH
ncbi:hypothetical protein JKP88DRAFT_253124 [Tribonema minus]|uniref:Uncharacterized protein n=1 Tax=Tribonema minus TaxID=303371 RepID=A0A836CKS7_9STRA|nr:hypothetical protein JKP88DRAFT_253124 [Tribonema minus]